MYWHVEELCPLAMAFLNTDQNQLWKDPTFYMFTIFHIQLQYPLLEAFVWAFQTNVTQGKKSYVQLSPVCSAPMWNTKTVCEEITVILTELIMQHELKMMDNF